MATDTLDAMRKMMALQKEILANVVTTAENAAVAAKYMKRPIMVAGDEDDVPFYPTNSDITAAEYIATTLAPVLDIISTSSIVRLLAAGTLLAIVTETTSPANNQNGGDDGNLVLGTWALSMGLAGVAQRPVDTLSDNDMEAMYESDDLIPQDPDFTPDDDMPEFEQTSDDTEPSGDIEDNPPVKLPPEWFQDISIADANHTTAETEPEETGPPEESLPPKPSTIPNTLAAKLMEVPIPEPKLTGNPTPRWMTPNKDK